METVFAGSRDLWAARLRSDIDLEWNDDQIGDAANVMTAAHYQSQSFSDFARKLDLLPGVSVALEGAASDDDMSDSLRFIDTADDATADDEFGPFWIIDLTESERSPTGEEGDDPSNAHHGSLDIAELTGRHAPRAGLSSRSHLEVLAFLAVQSYQTAVAAATSAPRDAGDQAADGADRSGPRAEAPAAARDGQFGIVPIGLGENGNVALDTAVFHVDADAAPGLLIDASLAGPDAGTSPAYAQSYPVTDPAASTGLDALPQFSSIGGNDQAQVKIGTAGNDVLVGGDGDDILLGGDGDDTLAGNGGSDILDGGRDNDLLDGGTDGDLLIGGEGVDTASYTHSAAAVQVDLTVAGPQQSSGEAAGDILVEIENVTGSSHDDTLAGDSDANVLAGGDGDDHLEGGGSGDTLVGGEGADTASYTQSAEAVQVDLAEAGPQRSGGEAAGDILVEIENVTGSSHDDTLTGNDEANTLAGGDGDDHLEGGGSGDTLVGGDGADTANYTQSAEAVQVDLAEAGPQKSSGDAAGDILVEIENVTGSSHDDTLTGDDEANTLSGGDGDDHLEGGGGGDTLIGGLGSNTASYERSFEAVQVDLSAEGLQESTGDAAGDTLVTIQSVIGSAQGDVLTGNDDANVLSGNNGDDAIEGGGGCDLLDGGNGSDTVSYVGSGDGVRVDLSNLSAQVSGGDASGDILVSIENVTGSSHDDDLTGDGGANALIGGGGDDVLNGNEGADTLDGNDGNDTVSYASSAEAIQIDLSHSGPQDSGGDGAGDIIADVENVIGSSFDDAIAGDDHDNTLIGGAGDDTLVGSTGDDLLDGGSGKDAMSGGTGNDIYVVDNVDDSIFEETGCGTDTVTLLITHYTTAENIENVIFVGSGEADITGNDLANLLVGGSLSDILYGGDGDDDLRGGDGDDDLDGGDGDDRLDGGDGYNRLDGGAGNDWLITFSGKDTIVLRPGFGNDVLEGFGGRGHDGFDLIDVSAYNFDDFMLGTDILILSLGDDAVLSIGSDTLTLLHTKASDVNKSDFIYH